MSLPTDAELLEDILATDKDLAREKAEINDFEYGYKVRRRVNPKGAVILRTPFAGEGVERLFPKVAG
jgi:ribosomal protein L19